MSKQHKLAAARRGAARTEEMEQKVIKAMQGILADMEANEGIYPYNGGAVSMAELAKRAKINESSFYKKEPKNVALKERAELWLDTLKKEETVGRKRVKKTLSERAEDWHKKYLALEQRHLHTELELQASEAEWEKEREESKKMFAALEREITELRNELRKGGAFKVAPFQKEIH